MLRNMRRDPCTKSAKSRLPLPRGYTRQTPDSDSVCCFKDSPPATFETLVTANNTLPTQGCTRKDSGKESAKVTLSFPRARSIFRTGKDPGKSCDVEPLRRLSRCGVLADA